jgi:ketosteroid isomerase-like protein
MIKTIGLLSAFAFGLMADCNAQNQKSMDNQKKQEHMETNFNTEQKKVFSTIEKMVRAFQNKDIEGVLATYEPDAIVMFEPQQAVAGHDALKLAFTQFVGINPQYTFGGHEIYISGNIATHVAPWTMKGLLPDGTKIEQSGLSIAVLRKQADGQWLMIQDNPHGQFLLNK